MFCRKYKEKCENLERQIRILKGERLKLLKWVIKIARKVDKEELPGDVVFFINEYNNMVESRYDVSEPDALDAFKSYVTDYCLRGISKSLYE